MNLPSQIRNLALTKQIFQKEGIEVPREVTMLHHKLMERIVEENKQGVDHYDRSNDDL